MPKYDPKGNNRRCITCWDLCPEHVHESNNGECNECAGNVWRHEPKDDHFWAFYYFCKRLGDKLIIKHKPDNHADLIVIKR